MYLCIYIRFEHVSLLSCLFILDEFRTGLIGETWELQNGEASWFRGGSAKAMKLCETV